MSPPEHARKDRESGFTLIELLVVMIIIGIIAAIAIPTFLNQRENGYRTAMKSDLRNAATASVAWAAGQGGSYTGLNQAILDTNRENIATTGVAVTVRAAGPNGFCLQADHAALPAEPLWFDSTSGGVTGVDCTGSPY